MVKQHEIKMSIVFPYCDDIDNKLISRDVEFLVACIDGNVTKVQTLLDTCAIGSSKLETGFIFACKQGNLEMVVTLVNNDIPCSIRDSAGLKEASKNGFSEIVLYLLQSVNPPNIHVDEDYCLVWAARNGHLETVEILLEHGANIHAQEDYALMWACKNGHLEIVQYLLLNRATIHNDSYNALWWACEGGNIDIVKCVGAKANYVIHSDYTMIWVISGGYVNIVKKLVEEDPTIRFKNDYLISAAVYGEFEMLKYLLTKGLKPEYDALKQAVERGYVSIFYTMAGVCSYSYLCECVKTIQKIHSNFKAFDYTLASFYFAKEIGLDLNVVKEQLYDANIGLIVCSFAF